MKEQDTGYLTTKISVQNNNYLPFTFVHTLLTSIAVHIIVPLLLLHDGCALATCMNVMLMDGSST
jgi:hypothetical protein